jgi:hypothetical protein
MSEIPAGAMRFNSDSQKLEYWNGSAWFQVHTATPDLASAGDPTPGARAVFSGGANPAVTATQEYLNIASGGTAQDFGNLTVARRRLFTSSFSDSTRGVIVGGFDNSNQRTEIDKITFASTGSAASFGTLATARQGQGGFSNSTRGFACGGTTPSGFSADIFYFTIQSDGNGVDFGADLTEAREGPTGASNSTRGLAAGGYNNTPASVTNKKEIDLITIPTLGNVQDFGDLSTTRRATGVATSTVRAVFGGGYEPSNTNLIEYVEFASLGNATGFGDCTKNGGAFSGTSDCVRGIFAGGYVPGGIGGHSSVIESINISTEGNANDFADLSVQRASHSAISNAHGGL